MGEGMMVAFQHIRQVERWLGNLGKTEANSIGTRVIDRKARAAAARIAEMAERIEDGCIRLGGWFTSGSAGPHPGVP